MEQTTNKETKMESATEVKNVFIPICSIDGWLIFKYTEEDKVPYKWPKVLKYQNKLYAWMSWNSDNMNVNYKQISQNDLATKAK